MSDSDSGNLGDSVMLMPDSNSSDSDGNIGHDQDNLIMSDSQSEQSAPGSSARLGHPLHDPQQLTTGLANLPDLNENALVMPDSDKEGEKILRLVQIEAMSGSERTISSVDQPSLIQYQHYTERNLWHIHSIVMEDQIEGYSYDQILELKQAARICQLQLEMLHVT
ncbi:hypothetical protein HYPSUDRAFT_56501 [Hypholoma sublateritium FD-334 SS-4]|uniref:Uncharacterized protein n=1 Tax=Hypholoma sublateritium (strain FD-334 SS-4) TaxID=945553 RepID=A0A0D2M8L6_HYPSF|nr:hypothetical protein HYPSUDRAFT_56501 [Hypholoma sublateritium FD-334 SS-4]